MPPAPPPVPRAPTRSRAPAPPARPGLPSALALVAAVLVVAIHAEAFPYPAQQHLRDWVLHFAAVLAATMFTAAVVGYRRGSTAPHQRTLLAVACAVPVSVCVLHELGQWLWPAQPRDGFDAVRDTLLDVAGAGAAWWALRRRR